MTEMPSKIIITIVILVLTVSFITGLYAFSHTGRIMMWNSNSQQDKVNNMYEDSKLTQYIGRRISGSQITQLMDDYYDGTVTFKIKTGSGTIMIPDADHKDKITCISYVRERVDITSIYDLSITYDDTNGSIKSLDFNLSTE